jgi:hypothetical protein
VGQPPGAEESKGRKNEYLHPENLDHLLATIVKLLSYIKENSINNCVF